MKQSIIIISIISMLILSCGGKGHRSEFGKINSIIGQADIYNKDKSSWIKAEPNKKIQFGDSIRTGSESEIAITFGDNTVKLGENTTIAVYDTVDSGKIHRITVFNTCGEVLSDIKKLSTDDSRYEVCTPTAVAAIRGTHFLVFFTPASAMTDIRVLDGKVWAFNPFIPAPPVIILPGFVTMIHFHEAPFMPVPINYGQFKKMERMLGGKYYGRYLKKFKVNRHETNMFLPLVPFGPPPPGHMKKIMKGPGAMFDHKGPGRPKGVIPPPVLAPPGMPHPQAPGISSGHDQKQGKKNDGKKGGGKKK